MIIDCISDLHGYLPPLQGGDLLIVAGDLTARDTEKQMAEFKVWIESQEYRKIILIAGNHDGLIEKGLFKGEWNAPVAYLEDSWEGFEGLVIWGSPWTPNFCGWHFMASPMARREFYAKMPDEVDILVTHGPALGILDYNYMDEEHCGCPVLLERIDRLPNLKLHVFGHIHEASGTLEVDFYERSYIAVNASIMDEYYQPTNNVKRIVL